MIISFDDCKALNRKSKDNKSAANATLVLFHFPQFISPLKHTIQPLLICLLDDHNMQVKDYSTKTLDPVTRWQADQGALVAKK
jgi:hypothetical protein